MSNSRFHGHRHALSGAGIRKSDSLRTIADREAPIDRADLSRDGMPTNDFVAPGRGMHADPFGSISWNQDVACEFFRALNALGVTSGGSPQMPTTTNFNARLAFRDKPKSARAALMAKSEVTVTDVSELASDAKAIRDSGVAIDTIALRAAIKMLAYAVAEGAETTAARTAFEALFAGTGVSPETIDKTFADLAKIVEHSNATVEDLDRIATGPAASVNASPIGSSKIYASRDFRRTRRYGRMF